MTWFGASAWIVTEPPPRGYHALRGPRPNLSVPELGYLYRRHRYDGVSLGELGQEIWQGRYSSPKVAANQLGRQFQRMNWPVRPVREASRQRKRPTGKLKRRSLHGRKTPRRKVLA